MFVRLVRIAATAVALATSAPAVAQDAPLPPDVVAKLNVALDSSFAASKAPGVVVGVWIPGKGGYVATRGYADPRTKRSMSVDDHFRIGSNSKTFTATLLLILADEGKLSLDDEVSKYAPWVPSGGAITLRMLADMTAGLHSYTEDDAWIKIAFGQQSREWTPRELVDWGLRTKPDFAPGRGWHYSNTNYVLLGMILEQAGGMPIRELLARKIYAPLGLKQTSFPAGAAMPVPFARGTTVQGLDGKEHDATDWNPSWGSTAGQMISTLGDMHVWVDAYTQGKLVSPAMQKARTTWITLPPNTPKMHYGIGMGESEGWQGHTGELPGYNTAGYYSPSRNATVVVLVNSDIAVGSANPAPTIARALFTVVEKEVAAK